MRAREQTLHEGVANALSLGLGLALAVASLPVLALFASRQGPAASVTGAVVFALTLMLRYLVSTVRHALPQGRWKRRFARLDGTSDARRIERLASGAA